MTKMKMIHEPKRGKDTLHWKFQRERGFQGELGRRELTVMLLQGGLRLQE